jgi:serine/threonine protein kinase
MPDELPTAPPSDKPPPAQAPGGRTDSLEKAQTLAAAGATGQHDRPPLPQVPGYEVLDLIAAGGMGVVYKARQLSLDRVVALKMLLAGAFAGPDELARFRKEAQAVAHLEHPHIVRIYDFGTCSGVPYFSMEFVEGGSLKQQLAAGLPSPREAAALTATLARAIHYAHQHGIVHRDLKPANILLRGPGLPLITDFGLAKRLDATGDSTASGALMGTAPYMAPEQASGKNREITPATDVWALGTILYELLTGKPPFEGTSHLDILVQVVGSEPQPPSARRSGVPQVLEAICLQCLHKESVRRYPTALALAEDLERFLTGETPEASQMPEWERHAQWAQKAGYEILEVLSYGLSGSVYKARQVGLDRVVALKIMPSGGSTPPDLSAFRREAQTIASLQHPNIVQVHDAGHLGGLPFFSMEHLDGGTLAAWCADRLPPPREAAALVQSLASAAHHAHRRGIIHRGLKPSNIMLSADGRAKIAGFRTAQLSLGAGAGSGQKPARRVVAYQAPELLAGTSEGTVATDVYSLGVILYFLLTGDAPFVGDTLGETARLICDQPPTPPRQVRPEVPRELETICLRCLEKDPSRRYASAADLATALDHFLHQAATPVSAPFAVGYDLLEEVSRGTAMTLYRAREQATGAVVALRVLDLTACGNTEERATVLRTAMHIGQLRHPSIAAIQSVTERQGRLLLSREWIEGPTLAQQLGARTWPVADAVALVETLARALAHAHRQGVMHHDLRPSNILLPASDPPQITDFHPPGFPARTYSDLPAPEQAFLAPEVLFGAKTGCGSAADLYSLGVLLYELFTGRSPYHGTRQSVLLYQMKSGPPAPSQLRPDAPATLDAICLKCLQYDPQQRYASAEELADALGRFLRPDSATAPAPAAKPRGLWDRLFGRKKRKDES